MERYEQLESLLAAAKEDFRKFYEDKNKAAGTRVRKAMLEMRNLAQDVRKEVQDIKNAE